MIGIVHNGHSTSHTYFFKGIYNDYTSTTTADVENPDIDGRVKITSTTVKNTAISTTPVHKMVSKTVKNTFL